MHENDARNLQLSKGVVSFRSDRHGRTPLHLAAWTGNVKEIALMLKLPEALRKRVADQFLSPETVEAVTKHCLPANKLTNVSCSPNVKSTFPNKSYDEILPDFQEGWTPLHAASARAQHNCVQLLLAAGVDATAQDVYSRTALDVAGCAHYMEHRIDVNNFMETVDLLLKAGGHFLINGDNNNCFDTPLHTAVELGSEAAVQQLLQAGASATVWNSRGLTAMHVCVEKRNKELLQLLANHKRSNEDSSFVTVDVKDRTGSTVLCAAVKSKWIQGVCVALEAEASIASKADEESDMNLAAQLRNINNSNEESASALFIAISHNHQDALELLLTNGFSIESVKSDKANLFHIATKHGRKEILKYLLEYDSYITKKLINMCDRVGPPLYYAIEYNHPDCAALLISKGAKVTVDCESNTTLLHIAARNNQCEIAEMIINNDSQTVHVNVHANYKFGWTPLHEACHYGNREMIVLLLLRGADLSENKNAQPSPFQLLLKHVSKPTELIQEVFNACITSQDESHKKLHVKCTIDVDYTVLNPPCENVEKSQMRVIQALLDTGDAHDQQKLLLHPLVESFVYRQWRSLSPFFYSSLVIHVFFVLSVNMFALTLFKYDDRKIQSVPHIFHSGVWVYFIYVSTGLITIQDILFIKKNGISTIWCWETWLRFLSTPLAITLPLIVTYDSGSQTEWVRLFSAITLLFTWFKILCLLSRFPKFGYYILMYEKVARRVINILVPLGLLIVGFCISFMIQFHAQPPFEGFWSSLLMTMVMMSELGYKDTFTMDKDLSEPTSKHAFNKNLESTPTLITLRLTFAAFLFLCSIVLMNMLVGVAINDVKDLEILGHRKNLEKQVEFITAFEGTASLFKKWFGQSKLPNFIKIRSPGYNEGTRSMWHHLYHRLREVIVEKAELQQKQSDNSGEPTTTQRLASLETTLNRIFEEICKLRRENENRVSHTP